MQMRRINEPAPRTPPTVAPDRRARAAARLDRNRIACAVASCLLAYGVARMLVGALPQVLPGATASTWGR